MPEISFKNVNYFHFSYFFLSAHSWICEGYSHQITLYNLASMYSALAWRLSSITHFNNWSIELRTSFDGLLNSQKRDVVRDRGKTDDV